MATMFVFVVLSVWQRHQAPLMSPATTLIAQLNAAVAPHLGSTDAASPKAVAKTLKKLAKHLAKQQRSAHKAAHSPKRTRKALAGELMSLLQGFLTPAGVGAAEPPKSVAKTIKCLAAQLDNDRRKQAKRATKAARTAKSLIHESITAPGATKRFPRKTTPAKAVPARAELPFPNPGKTNPPHVVAWGGLV